MENDGDPFPEGHGVKCLQFGHDVSVVENRQGPHAGAHGRHSSIWPRRQRRGERRPGGDGKPARSGLQFGHDVSVVENEAIDWLKAFLESLQFGHDVSVVENRQRAGGVLRNALLQFGHDVSVVENS